MRLVYGLYIALAILGYAMFGALAQFATAAQAMTR